MSQIIDELLKQNEFDIYRNPQIKQDNLKELALAFSECENPEILDYCKLEKCSSKQCWYNYVNIIDNMKYPQKLQGLPILFELLQDINWPVFDSTIEVLKLYPRKDIVPVMEYFVNKAYKEEDGMWISGILVLSQQLDIIPSEFQKREIYEYFQYNDIY